MKNAEFHRCISWIGVTLVLLCVASPLVVASHERDKYIASSGSVRDIRAVLTHGRGLPVCEAYLKGLNQAEFERPAYCGRSQSTLGPGFVPLPRRPLTPQEIKALRPWALFLTDPVRALNVSDRKLVNKHLGIITTPPSRVLDEDAREQRPASGWLYQRVDVDNDGVSKRIVQWSWDSADNPACGSSGSGPTPAPLRTGTILFVLLPNSLAVDQEKTIELFGHPDRGFRQLAGSPNFLKGFRIIGYSYGIFEHEGTVFFDTFFDANFAVGDLDVNRSGDIQDKRRYERTLADTLGVFSRHDRTLKQVCEYSVNQ